MTKEWESRVSMWINALKKRLYQPVGGMEFSYCTTFEHWPYETAMAADFLPIREGDAWGEEWEYGWFRTCFQLGEWAKGKRIVMDLDLGGEATLFVNGEVWGTTRAHWVQERHHYLCDNYLVRESRGNESFCLAAECYAGHDRPAEAGQAAAGPVGHGYQWSSPRTSGHARLGKCTYGVWNEEAYQLLLEVQVLDGIRREADPDSLRVAEVEQALREFTMLLDFSLEEGAFLGSIRECRKFLKPYLACENGSTVPYLHAVGHAHIDLAWLWPMHETQRKSARTMAAQVRHMEEYPEYKMILSQPALYEMIREHYPRLFTQLKEKAAAGQLIPEGGMWVESDTNIPSGESLIRQFLYGKKYFREEFGVESELLWLPDVFGYSAALPQIMAGCGIRYFATAKIFWTYHGGDPFPYHYFRWKGIDGSAIPSFIHMDYSSKTDAASLIRKWKERRRDQNLKRLLVAVGYGDGGGGATRDHIENVRLLRNCEGVPAISFSDPGECFSQLEQESRRVPEYVGELYFQAHRGTYTSQARIKKLNRSCEFALRETELWSSLAEAAKTARYPGAGLERHWKTLLKNQFHDILPGSSIHKVYDMAAGELEGVLAYSESQTQSALNALTARDEDHPALTVFNSLSWDRSVPVVLPRGWDGAKTGDGIALEGQKTKDGVCVQLPLPAMGSATIYPALLAESDTAVSFRDMVMENEWLRIVLRRSGEIDSLYDKETGTEWASDTMNVLNLYQDIPSRFEAWDIDSMRKKISWEDDSPAILTLEEQGPLFCEVRVEKKLHQSSVTQWIRLERGSRTVFFRTRIDWRETQKLLKVAFPVSVVTDDLVSEIQYGHIKRPNHKSRPYDRDRFEVCNHKWSALVEQNRGFALLNDSKYGISCDGNQMELTLLKSAIFPDESADKGIQEFTYALTLWDGPLASSQVVQKAYELNVRPLVCPGSRPDGSFLTTDNTNIIIDCVKKSDSREDCIVIRAYECMGSRETTRLHINLPVAECCETNMVEEEIREIPISDGAIDLTFNAFEVKTLVIKIRAEEQLHAILK